MKAVILAAGKGVRINGVTGGTPKCLLDVGGRTLIERQIGILRSYGISQFIVIVGCGADRVRTVCGPECVFVTNDRFETTNSLYSLWLARDHLHSGFVVLNADVLFDDRLLSLLLKSPHEDALLFEPKTDSAAPFSDEEMKVRIRDGYVTEISKDIDPDDAHGENVGIVKFGEYGAGHLVDLMNRLIASGRHNAWAPQAFQEFAKCHRLAAVPTRGHPWIEIDFAEDYQKACTVILPNIEKAGRIRFRMGTDQKL